MSGFGPVVTFYVLSALAIASALMVMLARTVIHAVLFLVLMFVALAALFVLLSADFVAVAQLLVYAGAIGVLVIFSILLTPPREMRGMETIFFLPGLIAGAGVAAVAIGVILHTNWPTQSNIFATTVNYIGDALLNQYSLAFEIASVLLLAATVAAIVLVRGRGVDEAQEPTSIPPTLVRRDR
jgi:NADH-quinone oxidoreductase subunit J